MPAGAHMPGMDLDFTEAELRRYSRHILLPEIGVEGQQKLCAAHALVLGAGGGAGRAIAMQCAMEGCERLVLVNRTREKAAQPVTSAPRERGSTQSTSASMRTRPVCPA